MKTIQISDSSAHMLDVIKKCDDLMDSLYDLTASSDIAEEYKAEIDAKMERRVDKIRNGVLDLLGASIRRNFLESEHTVI